MTRNPTPATHYFNPLRYWNDRPDFLAAFDATDAELDREDSLSERCAFQLGQDLGMLRLDPPSDSEGKPHWPSAEMERGYAHGLEQAPRRADVHLRKLLSLRVNAYARGIPVSSAITVDYLRCITVTVCPVSGVDLTQGTLTDADWSIDRLDNTLGYVPGNVCVVSRRVNALKGEVDFRTLADEAHSTLMRLGPDGFAAHLSSGLLVLEGFRLAALMAGPSAFAQGMLARYSPFAMAPGSWATLDAVVAGIHVECARSRIEGPAYARRKTLFKRLSRQAWRTSNRLVDVIRTELARGTHPADLWFDGQTLVLLAELMNAFMDNPPEFAGVDPQQLVAGIKHGVQPLTQYAR